MHVFSEMTHKYIQLISEEEAEDGRGELVSTSSEKLILVVLILKIWTNLVPSIV